MINIPDSEFTFTFSRSSGAGGQNVNKVNTKASLVWDLSASSSCSKAVKERFSKKYSRFIVDGVVTIHSQRFRSQVKNISDCKEKLHEFLNSVEKASKRRVATKPTKASVKRRLEQKSKDSKKKKLRQEKF